jgi:hypothetical protein
MAAQRAVGIVIQRRQRIIAVGSENLETVAAEQLRRGSDAYPDEKHRKDAAPAAVTESTWEDFNGGW